MCLCLSEFMVPLSLCVPWVCRCLKRPEHAGFPGTRVADDCKPFELGADSPTQILGNRKCIKAKRPGMAAYIQTLGYFPK